MVKRHILLRSQIAVGICCFLFAVEQLAYHHSLRASDPATQRTQSRTIMWGEVVNGVRLGTQAELPETVLSSSVDISVFFENLSQDEVTTNVHNIPPPSDFDIKVISSPGHYDPRADCKGVMMADTMSGNSFAPRTRYQNVLHLNTMCNFCVPGEYKLQIGLIVRKPNEKQFTVWSKVVDFDVQFALSERWLALGEAKGK